MHKDDFEELDEFILFFQIIQVYFILLFKIVLLQNSWRGKELNKFFPPQTQAMTFAFSSVFILILCLI